jgi:hypothetical protein
MSTTGTTGTTHHPSDSNNPNGAPMSVLSTSTSASASRLTASRLSVVGLTLAGLLLLAGCSSSSTGSAFGSGELNGGSESKSPSHAASAPATKTAKGLDVAALDPCSVIQKAEAEAIVQTTLSDGTDVKDPTQPSCTFQPDPNASTGQVALNVGAGAENAYNIDVNIGHTFTDVPGLGEQSHLEPFALFFTVKGTWVELGCFRNEDSATFNQGLIDEAKRVAERLAGA